MNSIAFTLQRIAVNIESPNEILDQMDRLEEVYTRVSETHLPRTGSRPRKPTAPQRGTTGRDLAEVRELIPNQLAQMGALENEERIA